jgi:hypothetical protein
MPRPPIKLDNQQVQRFLLRHPSSGVALSIIDDTISSRPTRRLSRDALVRVLSKCPTITTKAVDEVTGGRYGYSALAEYAALAREASARLAELCRDQSPPR